MSRESRSKMMTADRIPIEVFFFRILRILNLFYMSLDSSLQGEANSITNNTYLSRPKKPCWNSIKIFNYLDFEIL